MSIYMDNNNVMDIFEGRMENLYQTLQSDECFFVCSKFMICERFYTLYLFAIDFLSYASDYDCDVFIHVKCLIIQQGSVVELVIKLII